MARHKDIICRLNHIVNCYQAANHEWYENQGLSLDDCPEWPGDSIMVVSWPEHVIVPRYNGDCTITGPYGSEAEARTCARDGAESIV